LVSSPVARGRTHLDRMQPETGPSHRGEKIKRTWTMTRGESEEIGGLGNGANSRGAGPRANRSGEDGERGRALFSSRDEACWPKSRGKPSRILKPGEWVDGRTMDNLSGSVNRREYYNSLLRWGGLMGIKKGEPQKITIEESSRAQSEQVSGWDRRDRRGLRGKNDKNGSQKEFPCCKGNQGRGGGRRTLALTQRR